MTFLKWVGGKTQLLPEIKQLLPKNIKTYYEPFVGGGAVLFEILSLLEAGEITIKKIRVSDINPSLIYCYQAIQEDVEKLIQELEMIKVNYEKSKFPDEENDRKKIDGSDSLETSIEKGQNYVYYYYRKVFNQLEKVDENKYQIASLFIFLNKTCFRGLYRESKNGFNVPFGNYKNPSIYSAEYLRNLGKLLNQYDIKFKAHEFMEIKDKIKKDDFVYLDPPYYEETKKSFTDYHENGFGLKENEDLYQFCKKIKEKNGKFLLSNSCTEYILNKYQEFEIKKVEAKRLINSKNPKQKTYEVFIKDL
jgi:DNA adenine methylase